MKKTAILISMLLFLISGLGVDSVNASGAAAIRMSPGDMSVDTGESFSLNIIVDARGESLDTVRAEIDFDPAKIEVLSVARGALFPNESPANIINNITGNVSYGVFKFGSPVTGSGILATVSFRALSSGVSTVSVLDTSKLVADGAEKMDVYALGSAVVTIGGDYVLPTVSEDTATSGVSTNTLLEEQALVYYGALKSELPVSASDWNSLQCIAYGGCVPEKGSLEKEQEALALFGATYMSLPDNGMEWNVIHAIAYTNTFINWGDDEAQANVPTENLSEEVVVEEEVDNPHAPVDADLEREALVYFGAFFGRMPEVANDWETLHCMAYGGCQGDPRNLAAEQGALVTFGAKYAKMPETQVEWNVLHTLAYTDLMLANY